MLRTRRTSRRPRNKSRLLSIQGLESRIALTANPDNFGVNEGAILNVPAPGVLSNDTGAGPRFVISNSSPTTEGVAVTVNPDGSFSYNTGAVFENLSQGQILSDSFTYEMVNVGASGVTA